MDAGPAGWLQSLNSFLKLSGGRGQWENCGVQSRELGKPSPADAVLTRFHQASKWETYTSLVTSVSWCSSSPNCLPILLHLLCFNPASLVATKVSHENNVKESFCKAVSQSCIAGTYTVSVGFSASLAISRPCHTKSANGIRTEW